MPLDAMTQSAAPQNWEDEDIPALLTSIEEELRSRIQVHRHHSCNVESCNVTYIRAWMSGHVQSAQARHLRVCRRQHSAGRRASC